jgi:hypothetical protein
MANIDAARGLVPVRHQNGAEITSNGYPIASGYATAIYAGDPVIMAADGTIQQALPASAANLGVFAGVKYTLGSGEIKYSSYWPAGTVATNIEALVYDDPYIIFEIQSDATGAVAADVGQLANVEIVAGNALIGRSKTNLDISALTAATGKSLRILRLVKDPLNEPGPFSRVEVIFEQHAIKGVVAGVGGV